MWSSWESFLTAMFLIGLAMGSSSRTWVEITAGLGLFFWVLVQCLYFWFLNGWTKTAMCWEEHLFVIKNDTSSYFAPQAQREDYIHAGVRLFARRTFTTPPKKTFARRTTATPNFFLLFFGALFLAFSTYSKEDNKDGKEEVLDEVVMEHIK